MTLFGCSNNGNCSVAFTRHLCRFIGETVTIFTTSGGVSGCGFTGTLLTVNCNFVRIVTHQGTAPSNPLAENICGDFDDCKKDIGFGAPGMDPMMKKRFRVGSVCDIPIDRIVAFCHNAV
ncbi:MAG TPA: hypothetical protein DEG06_12455 [Lachnospiraceae bacterium]|uniref:hypothetical protein n=1 Tax=Muricomes intestini TaxID=1796634 RepID=UPI000E916E9C|nr:hypothetical protein [Lachnospiraceae bacterium]HBY73043.1 hypothetical protein [Lachnospiraceae bacterium]HCA69850.1 hypothetical protein [Lachnospiraceae bacterium]HCR41592.1 hypothetical protein [Lachnospiraceae bacterium]